jgi:hypothetical protein
MSSQIYRRMLLLYPVELRRDFGEDMSLAFAEDLARARRSGVVAVARVWWWSLAELFRIAIPAQRHNRAVVVPFLAFIFGTLWMGMPMLFTIFQPDVHLPMLDVIRFVLAGACAISLTSAVATSKPTFISLSLR